MRRANKILMATVAILLCLVLITTSVVSGVFARFAIVKKSETSVSFQNFGVNVTVSKNPDQKYKDLVVVETNKKGDSITMAIENIPLNCGSDYSDLIKIKFDGAPTVKVKVSLIFHIDYNNDTTGTASTLVPASTGLVAQDTYFMPLGFTFGANDENGGVIIANDLINKAWLRSIDETGNGIYTGKTNGCEQSIRTGIKDKLGDTSTGISVDTVSDDATKDYGFFVTFDPNDATTGEDIKTNGIHFHSKDSATSSKVIKEFVLGFKWPLTWPPEDVENTTGYDYDALSLYLAQNADGKPIKIWYTVKIEQA